MVSNWEILASWLWNAKSLSWLWNAKSLYFAVKVFAHSRVEGWVIHAQPVSTAPSKIPVAVLEISDANPNDQMDLFATKVTIASRVPA